MGERENRALRKVGKFMPKLKWIVLVFGCGVVVLAVLLTGCVGYVAGPRQGYAPPPDYVGVGGAVQDDYFYYPGYQVYFSSYRHQYIYQDGGVWVSRPAPARVSVNVLLASPAVRLDFHDAPSFHHAAVVQQYPQHWAPPESRPNRGKENRDHPKGNDRGDRR